MKIRFLGAHNCESQHARLSNLLIDDVLALDAGGLTSTLAFSAQRQLRAILLSHQHYDHARDILTLAMNLYLSAEATVKVYSLLQVYQALKTRLFDGELYPNFLEYPEAKPTIDFVILEPLKPEMVEGYSVLAVPVKHAVPAVGYQVTSPEGKVMFYTSDTGPGLRDCWEQIAPQLLVIELTAPNRFESFCCQAGHLTPGLLKQELSTFRELKGYLPQVVTVHMNPWLEEEIRSEIAAVAAELDCPITPGYEGMELSL